MKISIPVLFGCSGISFAFGFALAWQILPAAAPADRAGPAQAAPAAQTGANQVADLWNGRGAPAVPPAAGCSCPDWRPRCGQR